MEVVVIRPIPRSLLPHTVTYGKNQISDDIWEAEITGNDGIELSFVRIEPSSKIIRDKNNVEIQLAATMFYDCKNSRPQNVIFAEDDVIVFNGQKHSVKTVEPLYDRRHLHHYELGLIKHV